MLHQRLEIQRPISAARVSFRTQTSVLESSWDQLAYIIVDVAAGGTALVQDVVVVTVVDQQDTSRLHQAGEVFERHPTGRLSSSNTSMV